MTQTSFFTNFRLSIIYMVSGYAFFFGGTTLLEKGEMQWVAIGASLFFLILSLYHVTKVYGKDFQDVKVK